MLNSKSILIGQTNQINTNFIDAFENQVQSGGDKLAIQYDDISQYSYLQLNSLANQIAKQLKNIGIQKGDKVAIYMDQCPEHIFAILAILKIGAVFISINCSNVISRLHSLLTGVDCKLVISSMNIDFDIEGVDCISIHNLVTQKDEKNLGIQVSLNDPAYLILTSGTTKTPKLVELIHRGLMNLAFSQIEYLKLNSTSRVMQFASMNFDASVSEWSTTLLSGGTLIIPSNLQAKLADSLVNFCNHHQVTHLTLPPSLLLNGYCNFETVNTLIIAGEKPSKSILENIPKLIRLINAYGPSEATVCASMADISEAEAIATIGKPIYNTTIYLLDENGEIVERGLVGEICVAGAGIANGYINNSALNRQKFIENPYYQKSYPEYFRRLYKTGDRAKLLLDSNLEYIDRQDEQIKLNGYRIDLTEVKARISQYEFIKDCLVRVERIENYTDIVAYVLLKSTNEAGLIEKLKNQLAHALPVYMVPKHIIVLSAWPLKENGKIDEASLLYFYKESKSKMGLMNGNYENWRHVWSKVLGLDSEEINLDSNFFQLGGDSISAMRLRMEAKRIGINLTIETIYNYPTLEMMDKYNSNNKSNIIRKPHKETNDVTLHPIQAWFFEKQFHDSHHWNQSVQLTLAEGISLDILKNAIYEVYWANEIFSLRYHVERKSNSVKCEKIGNDKNIDSIFHYEKITIEDIDANNTEINRLIAMLQSSLNYSMGDIFKALVIEACNEKKLVIIIHHLYIDVVSWYILLQQIQEIYQIKKLSKTTKNNLYGPSYSQCIYQLVNYFNAINFQSEIEYWNRIPVKPPIHFEDLNKHHKLANIGKIQRKLISEEQLSVLHKRLILDGFDLYEIQLAALVHALALTNDRKHILINLESHGRKLPDNTIDLTSTVGWFTALFPFYLDFTELDNSHSFEMIRYIQEKKYAIPHEGIHFGFFKYLHSDLKVREKFAALETPKVCFNYLGQSTTQHNQDIFKFDNGGINFSSSEQNRLAHTLEINAVIINGELFYTIFYDKNEHHEITINQLLDAMHRFILDYLNFTIENNLNKIYPLTTMQQGLFFYDSAHSFADDNTYVVQGQFKLSGKIDCNRFKNAWTAVIEKHDAFRTIFKVNNQGAYQEITKLVSFEWHVERDIPNISLDAYLESIRINQQKKPFVLDSLPLMRIYLVSISETEYIMIWTLHHIIADGWCTHIVIGDLFDFYQNNQFTNSNNKFQLRNYFNWLESQNEQAALNFWNQYLASAEGSLFASYKNQLKFDNPSELIVNKLYIAEEIFFKLSNLCKAFQCTIANIIQLSWAIVCSVYLNKQDIIYGYVLNGRDIDVDDIENAIGVFIRTVPVRTNLDSKFTIRDLIKKIYKELILINKHSFIGLNKISHESTTLFDSLLVVENYPAIKSIDNCAITIDDIEWFEKVEYPVKCTASINQSITIEISADSNVLSVNLLENMAKDVTDIFQLVADDPDSTLHCLKKKLTEKYLPFYQNNEFNYVSFDETINLYSLIKRQIDKRSDEIAIIDGDLSYTYRDLDKTSDLIANAIFHILNPGQAVIGILLPRSFYFIATVIAAFKLGAAYCPIDILNPRERIQYIISNSDCRCVVTENNDTLSGIGNEKPIFLIKEIISNTYSVKHPESKQHLNQLANVIYTSGTTGNPKGVMTSHRGLVNRILWMATEFNINPTDVILNKTSVGFDVFGWEIFLPLVTGAKCIIANTDMQFDLYKLNDCIEREDVTHIHFVPSMLRAWIDIGLTSKWKSLKAVILSGEALSLELMQKFSELSQIDLYNLYGPTEASIDVTFWHCNAHASSIKIGKPISNTHIYILSYDFCICPPGVTGDLYIAGDCLAYGYINNPELTQKSFFNLPESSIIERVYKSGDLARLAVDGNFEFLGRSDSQIKLRGYRIELIEIEMALKKFFPICNAIVLPSLQQTPTKLIAFIQYDNKSDTQVSAAEIIEKLQHSLPEYMIPKKFVTISAVPLTLNGKVDTKKLLSFVETDFAIKTIDETKNITEKESIILDIIRGLLANSHINLHDNFLSCGGDSIFSIQLSAKAKFKNIKISLNDIMSSKTIGDIAHKSIFEHDTPSLIKTPDVQDEKVNLYLEKKFGKLYNWNYLTYSQMGILLSHIKNFQSHNQGNYILHHVYKIRGNSELIKAGFHKIINQIPQLRAGFLWHLLRKPIQYYPDSVEIHWDERDLSKIKNHNIGEIVDTIKNEASVALRDILQGNLMRFYLLRINESSDILIWSHHHILFDGWSIGNILEQIWNYYDAQKISYETDLYHNYLKLLSAHNEKSTVIFWKNYLADAVPSLLANKYKQLATQLTKYSVVKNVIQKPLDNALIQISKSQHLTINTLCFYCWSQTICTVLDQLEATLGMIVSGRDVPILNFDKAIGMFIATLPIKVKKSTDKFSIADLTLLQKHIIEVSQNNLISLSEIQSFKNTPHELFDTLYVFENYPNQNITHRNSDLEVELVDVTEHNEYALSCIITKKEQLEVSLSYDTSKFTENDINHIFSLFNTRLLNLANHLSESSYA